MNIILMFAVSLLAVQVFYKIPQLFIVFIANTVFALLPKLFPRISTGEVLTYQIFTNCMFLLYYILPSEFESFNVDNL